MPRCDVVVVGAGLAGLTCADTLVAAGCDVVVLEARARVGGRTYSRREGFAAGQVAESGAEYLDLVRDSLPEALDAVRPDLVAYNAGSDPFVGDPLARYRLSAGELAERDLLVATEVRGRAIPLAMVLSGGYSAESWKIHADAIEGILTGFGDPA